MKNLRNAMLYTIPILVFMLIQVSAQTQTYASPEMKARVEKEYAEKLERLGINPEDIVTEQAEKLNLDEIVEAEVHTLKKSDLDVNFKDPALFKLKSLKVIDLEEYHTEKAAQDLSAYQKDVDSDLKTYSIYIDWKLRKSYTITNNTKEVVITDLSHIDPSDVNKIYGCEGCSNNYTFHRLCENTMVFRYPYQDEHSGNIHVEYLFVNKTK